jgi:hypothetical protein
VSDKLTLPALPDGSTDPTLQQIREQRRAGIQSAITPDARKNNGLRLIHCNGCDGGHITRGVTK